ncbi:MULTISPECIES: hypothetical protein [unclassified Microbacterium]|uniref:hypothetical protein n=1 Tax=unclassified Microbacterium TaxID=2609290 RepID=UPI000D5829D2|nr:hypothetical protein [Microbacterium sp. Gd 4-13]PVW03255.1 hypothetical protein DEA06_13700 [Microbacterium sp. Gd 4-13]
MSALESNRITEVILGVEGVVDAFPPPSIPRLIAAATGDVERAIVATNDGLRVDARIATKLDARSADSARAVADALLAAHPAPDGEIRIQIARIR